MYNNTLVGMWLESLSDLEVGGVHGAEFFFSLAPYVITTQYCVSRY